jgi:hypothetical protein
MDGDDELFKETENLLEEGQFRVMKDDNRWRKTKFEIILPIGDIS